jgi:hypothetical protein
MALPGARGEDCGWGIVRRRTLMVCPRRDGDDREFGSAIQGETLGRRRGEVQATKTA